MAFGDYLQLQRENTRKIGNQTVLAANAGPFADVLAVRSANHQLFIQKITVSITTHADQTITFQDDAGTPVVVAALTDEATVVPTVPPVVVWDFGPNGLPLTVGTNLDVTLSGAGIACRIHVEGYEKLANTVAQASTN